MVLHPASDKKPYRSVICVSVVAAMFGLLITWSNLSFRGATLLNISDSALGLVQDAKISSMFALALASLLMPFLRGLGRERVRQYLALGIAAMLISGGMACCAIDTAAVEHSFPFINFGLTLSGIGLALMTPFIGRLFFDIGPKATTISMLVGYIFSTFLVNIIWGLPNAARFAVTLIVPILQFGLMILYVAKLETSSFPSLDKGVERQGRSADVSRPPLPPGLLAVVLLSGLLGSFVRGAMYYSGFDYSVISVGLLVMQPAALLVLVAVLGFFGKGYDSFSIFWPWAALPMLACCIALPFIGESSPIAVADFFVIAHNLCSVFNYTIFVDIAVRYNRDVAILFCWGRAFDSFGCIIGFVLGAVIAVCFPVAAHLWYALSLSSSYAIVVLFVLVFRSRHITDFEQCDPAAKAAEGSISGKEDPYHGFSSKYSLTDREAEVLEQLNQGRSVPYISQKLLISASTTKTHVQSIYRKLGVHTRQELLDMIRKG